MAGLITPDDYVYHVQISGQLRMQPGVTDAEVAAAVAAGISISGNLVAGCAIQVGVTRTLDAAAVVGPTGPKLAN